ncbi:MAG: sorbosone dehydrogenase family protein [Xanthobacteraceae bacterium]|jgi:glucose/arabinose dehydrogenase
MHPRWFLVALAVALSFPILIVRGQTASDKVLTGKAAFGDWRGDLPGLRRKITAADLPAPYATRSASNFSSEVAKPRDAQPKVPSGFTIRVFANGLAGPRIIRAAPNGDIFVAETGAGRIRVLRPSDNGETAKLTEVFASGLHGPFGIAFYPNGSEPEWLYVANNDSVVRFAYRGGDTKARGAPEVVVPDIPGGRGHSTRDLAFSLDGTRMFVSAGSSSNAAEGTRPLEGAALQEFEALHGVGASAGAETDRADVLVFDPQGGSRRVFATGIRNCVGLAVQPGAGDLWCSTNERDGLGDDVPPDYITRVREGGFYGWPWYYIGDNEDPRHAGERPDLKGKVIVPDVLLQAHSASLGLTFYQGQQFPADHVGNAFAAEHGSWNRSKRTGYKVVRVIVKDGVPTGEYEDFVTGFVVGEASVWGRPVGVTVARDGSLLVSEDANGTIWRVSYAAP